MLNCVSFSQFGLGTMSPPSVSLDIQRPWVGGAGHTRSLMRRLPPAGIANGASTWQDRTVMDIVGSTWREMDTKCQCNGKQTFSILLQGVKSNFRKTRKTITLKR